jgi:hypothetical protein
MIFGSLDLCKVKEKGTGRRLNNAGWSESPLENGRLGLQALVLCWYHPLLYLPPRSALKAVCNNL